MQVGVQQGTTADFYLSGELPDVECVRYSKALDGVMDLKIGRLDAVMVDAAPSEFFVKAVQEGQRSLDGQGQCCLEGDQGRRTV